VNRRRISDSCVDRHSFFLTLSLILLLTMVFGGFSVAQSDADASNKAKVFAKIARNWIAVGTEQYQRGLYSQAQQSFSKAIGYQDYLSSSDKKKVSGLLEKTRFAGIEKKRVLTSIKTADDLIGQGKLVDAQACLEAVADCEFLSENESQQITEELDTITAKLNSRRQQDSQLYRASVKLYRTDELEKAREGFASVAQSGLLVLPDGKRAQDYIKKIDAILAQRADFSRSNKDLSQQDLVNIAAAESVEIVTQPDAQDDLASGESDQAERISNKENVVIRYTEAVIKSSLDKVEDYMSRDEFDYARQALSTAEQAVSENRSYLGNELYAKFSVKLKGVRAEIDQKEKTQIADRLQEQRRLAELEKRRAQLEKLKAERIEKVSQLAELVMDYMRQGRYEEALEKLQELVAIEPINEDEILNVQ